MTYTAKVPSSVALPSDPDDQSPDYDVEVEFEWSPGTMPSGLSGPPEYYDPGEPDEFDITSMDPDDSRYEAVAEWLDQNWPRPVEEDDYSEGCSLCGEAMCVCEAPLP
jgi:hypothetical protein